MDIAFMEITIHRGGENYGPYTTEQIQEYLKDGTLIDTDLAWHDGCVDWLPLKEIIVSLTGPLHPPIVVPLVTHNELKSVSHKKRSLGRGVLGWIISLVLILTIISGWLYASHLTTTWLVSNTSNNINRDVVAVSNMPASALPTIIHETNALTTTPLSISKNSSVKTNKELFTGNWRCKLINNGVVTLIINLSSDGENIIMLAWMPQKTIYGSCSVLSFSQGAAFSDGKQSHDNVRVASFRFSNPNDPPQPNLLMTTGDGEYILCLQSDENKTSPLEEGLLQFPSSDDTSAPEQDSQSGQKMVLSANGEHLVPQNDPDASVPAPAPTMESICGLYSGTNTYGFPATIQLGEGGTFLLKDQSLANGMAVGDWTLDGNTIDLYIDGQKTSSANVQDDGGINLAGKVWKKIR